jgi:hypothetical protein
MNSLKFDGQGAWFVTPDNKYGLSRFPMKNITEGDFSFLTTIRVDWDKMNPDDNTREGGVIIKNGLHLGLSVVKPNNTHVYIKGTIWTVDASLGPNGMKPYDILVKVNDDVNDLYREYKIGFSFKKKEKQFSIYCDGTWLTERFEGSLIDYSNAWLWLGAANPLESCPVGFRQYFMGEMFYAAIFSKFLDRSEIEEVYGDPSNVSKRLKPTCVLDFKKQTPYKVLDISETGNNLIRFDKEWMGSI